MKQWDEIVESDHMAAVFCIAVTTAINWEGGEGGRRKLVYSCGEIGLCPPRRGAHPPWGVGSPFCGGWGEGGGRTELPPLTHRKWGINPPFAVGGGREE